MRVLASALVLSLLAAPVRAASLDRADPDPPLRMYRAAEASLRIGEYSDTRRQLRVLIERYPGTEWAERARRLLDAVPGGENAEDYSAADAPYVPAMPSTSPEEALGRLRAAVSGGTDDQALGEAYDLLRRYPGRPERAEVELAAGALHLRRGEPRTALKFLLPIARAAGPLRTRAIHLAGGALLALGREGDVLKLVPSVDPAGRADRWLALAQVWRAAALERVGRRDDAADLYRAIAASGLESPVRAYALAAIAADWDRKGKPDRARDALSRAAAEAARWRLEGPRDALALAAASALARARRLPEAARAYLDFTRRYPNSPLVAQAFYERGLALKRLGDAEAAVRAFEALLDKAPDSAYAADAHLQLGQLDTELGRTGEALTHYRGMARASEAKDADREALLLMAQVHYNAKRWRDAIPLYRRWLNGAPPQDAKTKDVEGLLLVALWESDRKDPQLAELAARIPEHPLVAQIRWSLAGDAYRRGDWASAAELFERQIEKDPSSPRTAEARFYRAEALRQLGRPEEAAGAYKRYLSAHPKDVHAREAAMRLGSLLYEAGDAAGAAESFGRVTGDDADAADAAYNRALALAKAGRDPAGAWESFASRFPKHAKASGAWWTAARMREERHEDALAARDYARATGPDEAAKALYALGRLEERAKHAAAAKAAYRKLLDARPAADAPRLAGLLRLALILELEDQPRAAAPLYTEVMKHAEHGSSTFETARKRLEALTGDKSLVR